jgi:hypothetical protein
MKQKQTIKTLLKRAGSKRTILCKGIAEYFQDVATVMTEIGADRQGEGRVVTVSGKKHIVDAYLLTDGTTIKAGYPQ